MKKFFYYLSVVSFVLLFFCCSPLVVKAEAEKNIDISLTKEYVSATFLIEFDQNVTDCSVFIIGPDQKEYEASILNQKKAQCTVNNIEAGTWHISIYSSNMEEIGPVNVRVEGSKSQIVNQDVDMKVAADISGLKIYLKDESIVAEWNDNSCGNIIVTVADSRSLKILDKRTVSEKDGCYYEFLLPDNEEEILVSVVPASSSGYENADVSYTIKVDNHPSADITFEDLAETNRQSISMTATLQKPYKLVCFSNDKVVEETETLPAGTYTYDLPIVSGDNQLTVYVVADNGNMRSTSVSILGDFVAPELTVDGGSRSETVSDETYHIQGSVNDFDYLTINDKPVEKIYDDSHFEYDYTLHEGENVVDVIASDQAGNVSKCTLTITYVIPDYSRLYIFGGIAFIMLIIFLFIWKYHQMHPQKKNKNREQKAEKAVKLKRQTLFGKKSMEKAIVPVIFLFSFFIFMRFMVAHIVISSNSMMPTLKTGDCVFFNRLAYVTHDVQRGDIICFRSDEENAYMGKRVIGLPGETISFKDGYVSIDGVYLDESAYVMNDAETNCSKTFTVPEGCYFVLGDNRENSKDSRYFQNPYIPKEKIIGKYLGYTGFNISFIFE